MPAPAVIQERSPTEPQLPRRPRPSLFRIRRSTAAALSRYPVARAAPRRLPRPNRRPRSRAEHPVRAALLDLTPRRTVEVQPLLDHRAVAAPHPDDAARAATRTALGQRRLARIVRRGVRCRPAHRRAVRVLIRRIRAAPIERQHHRTPRAVNSPSAAGRRLAVHRPNRTRSPCHSSTATAPARGCSPAGTTTHTTMLTTSHEHSAAFIASLLPCPQRTMATGACPTSPGDLVSLTTNGRRGPAVDSSVKRPPVPCRWAGRVSLPAIMSL